MGEKPINRVWERLLRDFIRYVTDRIGDVTSLVQAQLDLKAPSANPTFTGNVTMPGTGAWRSTGHVGFGKPNPNLPLSFAATYANKIALYDDNVGMVGFGVSSAQLEIGGYSTAAGQHTSFGHYSGARTFTEQMRLEHDTGRLGIGTDSPSRHVEINSVDPLLKFDGDPTGQAHTVGIDAYGFVVFNDDATRYALILANDGGIHVPNMKSGVDQAAAGAVAGELYFDTNDGNTVKMGV